MKLIVVIAQLLGFFAEPKAGRRGTDLVKRRFRGAGMEV